MRYLIDIHSKPPMVVLTSDDDANVGVVGQRYADQVGRPLVVATGPAPFEPTFRPTVPDLEPPPSAAVAGVGVPSPAPDEDEDHQVSEDKRRRGLLPSVSYDPDRITNEQRAALKLLGVNL